MPTATRILLLSWVASWALFALIVALHSWLPDSLYYAVWSIILATFATPIFFVCHLFDRRRITRWRTLIIACALGVVGLYVAANCVTVFFITVLQECQLVVSVSDASTESPIIGASASLEDTNSGPRTSMTDSTGRAVLRFFVAEQPRWSWPRIGTFRFRSYPPLIVSAGSYETYKVDLSDLTIPYSSDSFTLPIRMQRATELTAP